jgi:hypothetical protein
MKAHFDMTGGLVAKSNGGVCVSVYGTCVAQRSEGFLRFPYQSGRNVQVSVNARHDDSPSWRYGVTPRKRRGELKCATAGWKSRITKRSAGYAGTQLEACKFGLAMLARARMGRFQLW